VLERGARLPESVSQYWATQRIWDRWDIETNETKNKEKHIQQRELTIDKIKNIVAQDLRVADLCCGTGRITYDLISVPNVTEVLAIDINENALTLLTERLSSHPARYKLKLLNLDFMSESIIHSLGKFDVVICLDSLHHLWNLPIALSRISQLLTRDGILIGNYLTAEKIPVHVAAKKGRRKYLRDLILAKLFIVLGFINWFWDFQEGLVLLDFPG
jgi:SAM-dependent methyltransferase